MKVLFSAFIIYIFLLVVFLVEGFGLPNGRQYARIIIGIFPFILFGIDIIQKHKIKLPGNISSLFVLFSITTAISTITAVNIQTAFENQLMYLGVFLTFIYVFNHQEVKKYIPHFIFSLTILFVLYSIFINYLLPLDLAWLIPRSDFQFVYIHNTASSHFTFGAFVLIPLILAFNYYLKNPTWVKGVVLSLLFIILLSSFLRASYVAFLAIVVLSFFYANYFRVKKISLILLLIFSILSLVTFFLITNFQNDQVANLPIKKVIVDRFEMLTYKTFLNSRDEIFNQAIESVKAKPLTGYGTFNYYYASLLYARSLSYITGSSHNVFLDIFVENGIFGGIIFLILVYILIKNVMSVISKKDFLDLNIGSVILSLLILFQFSHYHKFYFLFLIFFFLAALIYKEKKIFEDTRNILTLGAGVLFFFTSIIWASLLLNNNQNYKKALLIYPISVQAFQSYILSSYDQKQPIEVMLHLEKLSFLYPQEPNIQDFIGNIYTLNGDHQNALNHYLTALESSPSEATYLTFIYRELNALKGTEHAKQFVVDYIKQNITYFEVYAFELHWFYEWCVEHEIYIYNWMLLTE